MPTAAPKNINEYIAGFPKDVQKILKDIRKKIHELIPGAEEKISYAIPAFFLDGKMVVYFAGFKKHIGFYPAPVKEEAFQKAFSKYKTGRGSVQFPLDEPMPMALITRIVKFRLKDAKARAKSKKK